MMITLKFSKGAAEQLLRQLEDPALGKFSVETSHETLIRLLGAGRYLVEKIGDSLSCGHCGSDRESMRRAREFLATRAASPTTLQVALDKTLSQIPKASVEAAIELYANLFMLVDSNEYGHIYEENVVAILLLGWHDWNCVGGSPVPEKDNFCGCYPEFRRVIYVEGLRPDEMAPAPHNDLLWFHYVPFC